MKKLTLFAAMAVLATCAMAQNQWDGSTTSTVTTNGKVAIGTATPLADYSFTLKNTNNTQLNGLYNEVTNTNTSGVDQYGMFSKISFLGSTGTKVGFLQHFSSNTISDSYGTFLNSFGSNTGHRIGLVSLMSGGSKTECGIYSIVNNPLLAYPYMPSADRAAYFIGAVETVARSNSEKVFIINRRDLGVAGFGTDVFRIYGDGKVYATEINVKLASNFPDYVFQQNYQLMPLNEVKSFIATYHHLPNIPTAETVANEGINVGELNKVMIEKIEELTLYILQQQEQIDLLKQELITLKQR